MVDAIRRDSARLRDDEASPDGADVEYVWRMLMDVIKVNVC